MDDERVGRGNVALNGSKSSSSTYLSLHLGQSFQIEIAFTDNEIERPNKT